MMMTKWQAAGRRTTHHTIQAAFQLMLWCWAGEGSRSPSPKPTPIMLIDHHSIKQHSGCVIDEKLVHMSCPGDTASNSHRTSFICSHQDQSQDVMVSHHGEAAANLTALAHDVMPSWWRWHTVQPWPSTHPAPVRRATIGLLTDVGAHKVSPTAARSISGGVQDRGLSSNLQAALGSPAQHDVQDPTWVQSDVPPIAAVPSGRHGESADAIQPIQRCDGVVASRQHGAPGMRHQSTTTDDHQKGSATDVHHSPADAAAAAGSRR